MLNHVFLIGQIDYIIDKHHFMIKVKHPYHYENEESYDLIPVKIWYGGISMLKEICHEHSVVSIKGRLIFDDKLFVQCESIEVLDRLIEDI